MLRNKPVIAFARALFVTCARPATLAPTQTVGAVPV
jgi:hypothetical protein